MTAPLWMIAAALLAYVTETAAHGHTLTSTTLRLYRIGIAVCVVAAIHAWWSP